MKFSLAALGLLAGSAIAAPAASALPSAVVTPTPSITPIAIPSDAPTGQIITDLGPLVNKVLTVTGTDAKALLVELSPEVAALVDGLGLTGLGAPVGEVIKTAGSVGDLLKDLGSVAEGLLVVVGEDTGALLIQLSPSVTALVAGILPPLAVPVGQVIATLGEHLKRDGTGQLLSDAGKVVDGALTVIGLDSEELLLQLSPELTALVSGLGLPAVGVIVGEVVAAASTVGELLQAVGHDVDGLLVVVEHGAQFLLVSLSDVVAGLLIGIGLPELGVPVGAIVDTLAVHL
ncbi:hypothetical protein MPDQ_004824 [Monascus purpureus]|uniref:Uncharacterized protein n=1 Tax=Monascus purpureus TaxID=5098 RepID=A0A507QGZ3_MONPU|nr:hypothetical protein MPDQ_004824 [Monascus purpureus]